MNKKSLHSSKKMNYKPRLRGRKTMIAKLKDVIIDTATVTDLVEAEKCESCGKEDDQEIKMNL